MQTQNRAIGLMILAALFMCSMDATAKAVAQEANTFMALWARYVGQTLVVIVVVGRRLPQVARTRFPRLQALRSGFQLGATTCFFTGLSLLGLAECTAIMDISPVLITLGAALFLGERLGPRRLAGILAALIGALIIIRPGSGVLSTAALLPLGAACCYAGFALTTRHIGHREDPWTSLLYAALLGAAVLTVLAPFQWQMPSPRTALLMLLIAALGTLGQLFMIRALAIGEAAMLAPFSYVGLIYATVLGLVLFAEFPDVWTVAGALVVVAAGVYVWHRETRGQHPAPAVAEVKMPPEGL
ncbi:DMT family transporter [Pseudooceanicola sp. CBS1P-1]|uniref:EamA family transporter n=1 Tax=Pseudooceanicola albus TaxID=2692189 RepID=A0A6L7FZT4_9RHOB|nr:MULTISPECIES: DMT family transporter [Pseudooceanicola]MBT9382267.1 DMT family transporter [Pseudooceanicola endophyticus]MXN16810.1 EamA family transporter [Pseudooceanicola albus]